MARPAVRIQVVEFGVLVGLALLVGRAVQVQILHGRRWAEEAQAQRTERIVLQARRGTLYDRHGTPLAVTQETYHAGIAPNELRDPTADGALISRRLGLTARAWQLALRRRYAYFAGPYSALEVQPLRSVRGVHFEPVLNRFYPDPAVARATIGRLEDDGLAASGLERTLDSLLAGRAGDRPTGAGARRRAHARRGAAGDRAAGAGRRLATDGRGRRGRGDARSGDG